jgi:hypothetical protein
VKILIGFELVKTELPKFWPEQRIVVEYLHFNIAISFCRGKNLFMLIHHISDILSLFCTVPYLAYRHNMMYIDWE